MAALQKLLTILLCISLSGVLSIPRLAHASNSGIPSLQKATQNGNQISLKLMSLIRRAKHPNTPGSGGGRPTIYDALQVEKSFVAWKSEIERVLALPNEPASAHDDEPFLPSKAKSLTLSFYFNELSSLITLRIALGLDHSPHWRENFFLRLPKTVADGLPGLTLPAENRLKDQYYSLNVDRGPQGKADFVTVRLSEALVQGLELGWLAHEPNSEGYFTLVQYLATRQLLQNLASLRYFKNSHQISVPEIPKPLRDKLASMNLLDRITEETRRIQAEPGARSALVETYKTVQPQLPTFATPALFQAITEVILSGGDPEGRERLARNRDKLPDILRRTFQAADDTLTEKLLQVEIKNSTHLYGSMTRAETVHLLRAHLSSVKGAAYYVKLQQITHPYAGVLRIDQNQITEIVKLIDRRKQQYHSEIPAKQLNHWANLTRLKTQDELFAKSRKQFIDRLVHRSLEIESTINDAQLGKNPDPELLLKAVGAELGQLRIRTNTRQWVEAIVKSGDYISARDEYGNTVSQITSPFALHQGLVDPALVERYLEEHEAELTPALKLPEKLDGKSRKALIQRLAEGRKKDIRDLIRIGDLLGFNRAYPEAQPTVKDILKTSDQRSAYMAALQHRIWGENPVLTIPVTVESKWGFSTQKVPLHEALRKPMSPKQTAALIDQALAEIEDQIFKNIETVGHARDLKALEQVAMSSLMLETVLSHFPEFGGQQMDFVKASLRLDLASQFQHRYLGWYLGGGFGAIMLLHFSKWAFKGAAPYLGALLDVMDPMIKGFVKSCLYVIAVDASIQGRDVYASWKNREQAQALYLSSASGKSFVDFTEYKTLDTKFAMDASFFAARLILDGALFYYPEVIRPLLNREMLFPAKKRIAFGDFVDDAIAFKRLGLKPGQWSELDRSIQGLRNHSGVLSEKALAEAELAHRRLSSRLKAGKAWNLDAILDGNPSTAQDKLLRSILNPPSKRGRS